MRRGTIRVAGFAIAFSLIASCSHSGSSGQPAPLTSLAAVTRAFTVNDLPQLVMQDAQAPKGLQKTPDTGFKDVAAFTASDKEEAAIRKLGFSGGWSSVFIHPDLFVPGKTPPKTAMLVSNIAGVFRTIAGATKAMPIEKAKLAKTAGVTPFDAGILGAGSVGYIGKFENVPLPAAAVIWQESNAVCLLVIGQVDGNVSSDFALRLASTIAGNARR